MLLPIHVFVADEFGGRNLYEPLNKIFKLHVNTNRDLQVVDVRITKHRE
jgi:hypothetical protein